MIKQIKSGVSNCYLISGEEQSVLVDTMTRKQAEKIYKQIENQNVSLIILTHGHMDHISGAAYLSEKLGVPIAMHKDDAVLIKDSGARPMHANSFSGRMICFLSKFMKNKPEDWFEPNLFLEDGQSLSEYGVDAAIYSLPGHTKGSLGILVEGKDFIAGDAMMNMMGNIGCRLYEDKESMTKSLELIRGLKARTIYPGHGDPFNSSKLG